MDHDGSWWFPISFAALQFTQHLHWPQQGHGGHESILLKTAGNAPDFTGLEAGEICRPSMAYVPPSDPTILQVNSFSADGKGRKKKKKISDKKKLQKAVDQEQVEWQVRQLGHQAQQALAHPQVLIAQT